MIQMCGWLCCSLCVVARPFQRAALRSFLFTVSLGSAGRFSGLSWPGPRTTTIILRPCVYIQTRAKLLSKRAKKKDTHSGHWNNLKLTKNNNTSYLVNVYE